MKRIAIIASLVWMLTGLFGKASAQILPEVPDMKGKVTMGGDFDFGMSGSYLNFSIAPQVGYRILSPWEIGLRTVYNLQCYFAGREYSHYFGVAPYTNFQIYKGLFVHVEDEEMYGFSRYLNETVESNWYNSVFVGGGYRAYSYDGSYGYMMVLYNLSWDWETYYYTSPYYSPIVIRFGYCF